MPSSKVPICFSLHRVTVNNRFHATEFLVTLGLALFCLGSLGVTFCVYVCIIIFF